MVWGGVDFLKQTERFDGDIITNPPYKYAQKFVEHSLDLIPDGHKVAMFLKIQFLEGKLRRSFFNKCPPEVIYVASNRLHCAKNGDFVKYAFNSAVCYAWFIWQKGYKGETLVRWFN